ncbi:hypothetical protein Tco_0895258 [Tanacetum coccineum]|uniref:Uncharacterized protein n=1 Tax=Tanacetum coccineum TaxID=301880 RepID=A0ABQ5CHK1_9ASTR
MNDLEDDVCDGRDELADSEKMIGHCGGGDPLVFGRDGEEMDFSNKKVYVGDYDDDAANGRVQDEGVVSSDHRLYDHLPYKCNADDFERVCQIPKRGGSIPFEEALAVRVSSNLH